MLTLPSFEAGERCIFVGRMSDDDQRHLRPRFLRGGLGARWRNARGFALHLGKVRWPRRIAETCGLVFCSELEQWFKRSWGGIHFGVRVAGLRYALWNRQYGEVGGLAVRDLTPFERCGHASVREWADGIRRACSTILRVLV